MIWITIQVTVIPFNKTRQWVRRIDPSDLKFLLFFYFILFFENFKILFQKKRGKPQTKEPQSEEQRNHKVQMNGIKLKLLPLLASRQFH